MKRFYRRALVVPNPLLWELRPADLWDHNKPILSVVIPCYNYGRFIPQALQSLRSQTFSDFEIIVVDDGSDEELTLNVLDELRKTGVKVLRQQKLNVAAAVKLGVRATRGRYICRLDADDTIESTYFEKTLCLLESNPGLTFAYSLGRTFGEKNQTWLTEPFSLRLLLEYNHIPAVAVLRKFSWNKVGGYDPAMYGFEDWEFWINLGKAGFRGRLIPERLLNYRRHGMTLNPRSDRHPRGLLQRIRANHAELYSHLEEVEQIQKGYRDVRVLRPFLNLNSKSQYRNPSGKIGVVITSGKGIQDTESLLHRIASALMPEDDSHFMLITTDHNSSGWIKSVRVNSSQTYPLDAFLDAYCWLEFVLNLIQTRSARFVVVMHSAIGYGWTPTIKSHAAVPIVDVIHDNTECKLSARYDQFIDFHITLSAHIMKSLIDEFGVSAQKTCSFSEMLPLDANFHNLVKVLARP